MLLLDQDIWQNPKNLAIFPKVNNRKNPKLKALIFMHPKSTQIHICRPPKIGQHTKKPLKSPKIMQNFFKKSLKILQNTLFLNTPKWLSISGPRHYLAHAKKKGKKHPKKTLQIRLMCQNGFLFLDQANWRMPKSGK
jgi:hypothetical protein